MKKRFEKRFKNQLEYIPKGQDVDVRELIYLIHQKDEEAYGRLFSQMRGYTNHIYLSYLRGFISEDEWLGLAYEVFDRLINRYREDTDAQFGTLYMLALRRRATDLIRRRNTDKSYALRGVFSLDELRDFKFERRDTFTPDPALGFTIEEEVLTGVSCDQVLASLAGRLDETSMRVLMMVRQGYPHPAIEKILGLPSDTVRRVLRKAKTQFRKIEQENTILVPSSRQNRKALQISDSELDKI